MRRLVLVALVGATVFPSLARCEQPAYAVRPSPHVLQGPQLPAAADESREVVRLASAVDPGTLVPVAPHPVGVIDESSTANSQLLQQKLAELDRLQAEVDALRKATGTFAQILVRVEVLEVSLTKLKQLGVEIPQSTAGVVAVPESIAKLRRPAVYAHPSAPRVEDVPSDDSHAELVGLLKQNNIGKVFADPTLVVLSDRPASFLVGGQIPVPAAPGSKMALEFQEFGTRVDVRATSLGDDRVRLEVTARVSEIDDSRAIEIQGRRVPGFHVRQCAAGFEAARGETVIIGGGSQDRVESVKLPDGRIEERHNEIATWYVVRTEQVEPTDPHLR
jgi:Flp pilus assembly secretin CpaC